MSDTLDPRTSGAAAGYGLAWLVLATAYLVATVSGHRPAALAVVGLMAGILVAASGRRLLGLFIGVLLAAACFHWSDSLLLMAYAPPLAGFAFMAWFFGRTLAPGSDPLITRVARREHAPMPEDIADFTRSLTWAWTVCFALLFTVALCLLPAMPLEQWARWVHGLGYALPAGLFLGEYGYRHIRFRGHRHASLPRLIAHIVAVVKESAKPAAPAQGQGPLKGSGG